MTTDNELITEITWQDITVQIHYVPAFSEAYLRAVGGLLSHLVIKSADNSPLPITETGYKSHFIQGGDLDGFDTPADYVAAWLDHAALSPEWIEQQAAKDQMQLF